MKKILFASILVLMVVGCNSSSSDSRNSEPVEPVPPVYPQPLPPEPLPPEVTIPTAGIGSIKGNMDCEGGTIETNYSFGNVAEDDKGFVIQYQRNGALEDLTYPSTSTNGTRAVVKDIYYARPNDDERDVSWIVTISYQTPNQTYNLVTTTLKQPVCDDDVNATVTMYEVK